MDTGSFTLIVVAITVVVSIWGFGSGSFVQRFIFSPEKILRDKEGYRLITSGFFHADWQHLFFNMFSFYAFGKWLELLYGAPQTLLIYLGSILGGNLLSLFIHRHHVYQAYGASGGVCGIIYASIFLTGSGVQFLFIPITIPAWLYAI